ncbi:MAG: hypothetical protein DRR08_29405 [Candidatus Parabeggiatoa sp. nov. 2]|jgi:TolB-like protein|nr:MAG: hypothetical protein B6247_31335 [Beggiatoa sp. 4572_84]RKZ51324.1 MAG: hypothetical protein DRR08_29405 [Gammaproteobacteria bacterium]
MKSTRSFFTVSLLCTLLTGCSLFWKDFNLVNASYEAADALLAGITDISQLQPREEGIYRRQPILVTSFVNIDNLQESSTFGRVVAEQIGSRIAQQGYQMIEMKMRTSRIFVQARMGELVLSRELREISFQHDAYAVVVGTYAASKESVYVTAKLVRAKDSIILSSYDYWLPVGPDTKKMLKKKR